MNDAADESGLTPLINAAQNGHGHVIKLLVETGVEAGGGRFRVDVDQVQDAKKVGRTALHWAADRGLLEVTNILLDYGADVNARDLNEATPLMAACRTNALATARALLARQQGLGKDLASYTGAR